MSPGEEVAAQWCPKQEALLRSWAEKSAGYRYLHNHARLMFKRQNDWLSYPSIIIASITGVGGFATVAPTQSEATTSDNRMKLMYVQYFFAFLNVLGGVLTSIAKFNQSHELMSKHSHMCNAYSKFYRSIDMQLSLEDKYREPVLDYVQKMRTEFDRLLDDSPDIPRQSIVAFKEAFPDKKTNIPDVCNGLSIMQYAAEEEFVNKRVSNQITRLFRHVRNKKSQDFLRRAASEDTTV
jgi:hypothetical protein